MQRPTHRRRRNEREDDVYRNISFFLLCLTAALAVACAQLGLPTAKTFDEQLTASVSSLTAAREATTALLNTKKISSEDAEHVLDQLRNARQGLDLARTMALQNPAGANAK